MTITIAHNRLRSDEAVKIIRRKSNYTWDMIRDALLSLKAIDWTNEDIEYAARRPLRYDEWSILSQAY
jgi:hypothetical protein